MMVQPRRSNFVAVIVGALVIATSVSGQKANKALIRVDRSAALLKTFYELGPDSLPVELLRKAMAVAVFPGVDEKSTFLARSSNGRGVLIRKGSDDSWGTAIFLRLKATRPEFTPTLLWKNGRVDIVFLFMDDRGMDLIHGSWSNPGKVIREKLAIGPVVPGKGADTVVDKAWVLYYTLQDGKLSGEEFHNNKFASLTDLLPDDDPNRAIYGISYKEMRKKSVPADKAPKELLDLQRYMNENLKPKK